MAFQSLRILLGGITILAMTSTVVNAQSDNTKQSQFPIQTPRAICGPIERMSAEQFDHLMQTVRKAWLEGSAETAVTCFSPTAIFSIPPSTGIVGRENISKVFVSGQHRELVKKVDWHHLIFDPSQQIGAAEFTIERRIPTHGVIIIKISHGLISNWREYAIASDQTWDKFTGMNNF